MKNSPADSVSKSQRVRANAVWLMNAASLAVAITAIDQYKNSATPSSGLSIVPKVEAADYIWTGSGTATTVTLATNWQGGTAPALGTSSTASADTQTFGTAGTKYTVGIGSQKNFGTVTFEAMSGTTGYTFALASGTTSFLAGIAGGNGTATSALNNNFTNGNVTFNVEVVNVNQNNIWTGVAGSTTVFNSTVYMYTSGLSRGVTLTGAGNFTFNGKVSGTTAVGAGTTNNSGLVIQSTGTTILAGNNDTKGQLAISLASNGTGTVQLNGNNSNLGSLGLPFVNTNQAYNQYATWSQADANTYAIRLTRGTVLLGNNLALGTQDFTVGTASTTTNDTIKVLTNGAYTIANNIYLGQSTGSTGATYTIGGKADASSTFSGNVTLNKNGYISQETATTGSNKLTFSGTIAGANAGRILTFDGAGAIDVTGTLGSNIAAVVGSTSSSSTRVVTLSGNNTFVDGVTINSGVLALNNAGALNSTTPNAVTWGASTTNGTLRLNGNSVVVKSLTTNATPGTPIIENANAVSSVLTIGNSSNADSTFAGVIKDGTGAGTLGINKAGTGTLNLSGTNTYTGATNINAGSLNLTGSLASGSTVTVGASGTLKGTGTASGSVNVNGTINPGTAGIGTLTLGATDLKSGGTLNIQFYSGSGAAGSTGWDLLTTGVLSSSATSGSKFNINLISISGSGSDAAGNASVFDNTIDQSFEIIRSSSSLASFDLTKLNFSTASFSNGLNNGTWSLDYSGNSIVAKFAKFNAATISYWSAGTWADTSPGSGGAGSWDNASGSWDSTGAKTAVFAGASGGTVNVGTVTAKKGITFSTTGYTLTGGTITLSDSSNLNTVTVDSGTAEIGSALSGAGGFTKAGAGTLILSGSNDSLSGGMTIGLGTLKLGSANALGASSSNVSITSGAVLDLNGVTYTNTNALSLAGTGAITNTSSSAGSYAGNVTLTGTASYVSTSGAITMSGTTNLNGYGLTLTTGSGDITLSNNLSGTGSLTISPAGAGNVNISGGVNNSGTVTISPATGGGNTTISGNIGSSVTGITIGSSNTVGSATTVLLSGTNTYTGTIALNTGTLKLGSSSALGTSTNAVTANTYASGVAIDLNGQTTNNPLNVYGTGISNTGVITNSSSNAATAGGTITISTSATFGAPSGDITFSGAIKTSSATNRTLTIVGNTSSVTNVYVNSGVLGGASSPGSITLIVGASGSDKVKVSLLGTQALTTNGMIKIQGGTLSLASSSTLNSSGMSINSGASLTDNTNLLLASNNDYTFSSIGISGNLVIQSTNSANPTSITFAAGGNSSTNANYGQTGSSSKRLTADTGVSVIIGAAAQSTFLDLVGNTGTSDKLVRLDGAGNFTINSVMRENASGGITVKGGINKTGTGNLTLNAANTYTGGTIIGAGTLKVGNATALGDNASAVTLSSGATLDLNGTTMTGTNTLTSSGGTVTNSGAANATYAGALVLGGGTNTLNAANKNLTFSNSTDVTGAGVLALTGDYNGSIAGAIKTGANALNKSGAGTWTLNGTGANYSGATNITGGTLALGVSDALGSGNVTINGGTLALGSNSDSVGTVTLTSGSITGSGTLTSSATYLVSSGTISANLAGTSSAVGLNKTGSGTVTLTGSNTYTGVTYVLGGILELTGFGGIQGNTAGVATGANASPAGQSNNISSRFVIDGGTVRYTGAGETTDRKFKSGSSVTIDASGTGALVFNSSPGESWVSGTTNSTLTLTGTNTDSNSWKADIMDNSTANSTGVTSLVKAGSGTWVLTGTGSNFTGGTTISDGTLKAGTANIVGNITNNSVFELTNTSNGSYAGVISGNGTLNKSGSGAVTLTNDNTYTGVTNINAGSLVLGSNTGKLSGSSAINVFNGASLKSTNTTDSTLQASAVVLKSGALLDLTAGSLTATSLTVDALTGADVTKVNFGIGKSLSLTNLTLNGNIAFDLLGTPTQAGTYDLFTWSSKSGSGSFNLLTQDTADWLYTTNLDNTAKKYSITIAVAFRNGGDYSSGTIAIPDGKTLGAVSGTTVVSAAATTTVGAISGGTVTLNGSNNTVGDISGGTVNLKSAGSTVSSLATGGSLNVDANSTISSLTGGTLTVASGVDADVKAGTSNATITGSGNLLKSGNGKLTLSGTSSNYTGATKVAAGELEVTDVAALGSTSGVSLGTASSSTAATLTYSGGAATIDKNITALSTATSGNIVANSGSGLLTLSGNLTKDGTVLTLAGGSNGIKVTGNIIGTSANSDLVVSSGVVTVSSNNSYNGPTFIQNGATLIADSASATGAGIVNIANGATLQVGTATNILILTTGGFALSNGAHIKVYVDHIDITGLTANSGAGIDTRYTHFDLTGTAGSAYSSLFADGALDLSGVTAGGITIDVYSANTNTSGFLRAPFYDFKFLEAKSVTGLGTGLNISDLFTINTSNLKYADGTDSVAAQYNGHSLSDLIHVYTVNNGSNTVLMMSIPEPSTYGLGLGALALAAVAIRRRKQKKSVA